VRDDECLPIFLLEDPRFKFLRERYDSVKESIRTGDTEKNTALHIACQVGTQDIMKILLTHPDVETNVRNCEYKSPKGCIARTHINTMARNCTLTLHIKFL
jgi:ankyrin repeat protein